jgi:predicted RNA-binding Zn ribbon-like protein
MIGPAPGRLELVRAFVNTLDIEAGTDELSSPEALAAWLAGHGLTGSGTGEREPARQARQADLRRAVALREVIRDVLQSHVAQGGPSAAEVAGLRSLATGLPVRLEIGADGVPAPAAAGLGVAFGLAALLLIAAEAATLGTWPRLKVCSADDCRWAFYDRSPTRSGCWCSMAGCGARAKSRAYRQRAAASRQAPWTS